MSNIPNCGIIGGGFVGSSIKKGFQHYTGVRIYDLNPEKSKDSLTALLKLVKRSFSSSEAEGPIKAVISAMCLSNALGTINSVAVIRTRMPIKIFRSRFVPIFTIFSINHFYVIFHL